MGTFICLGWQCKVLTCIPSSPHFTFLWVDGLGGRWASCSILVLNYLQDGVNNFAPLVPLNVKHEEAITTTGCLLLNSGAPFPAVRPGALADGDNMPKPTRSEHVRFISAPVLEIEYTSQIAGKLVISSDLLIQLINNSWFFMALELCPVIRIKWWGRN